jgi:hypothetical protein
MLYDNAITTGSGIPGTMNFVTDEMARRARAHNRIDTTHAVEGGENNGKSVMFTITIDPVGGRFNLGESKFTTSAVAWGIQMGTFVEGTEWMTPTGRVRIIKGKLRYTSGRRLYKLPILKEDVSL